MDRAELHINIKTVYKNRNANQRISMNIEFHVSHDFNFFKVNLLLTSALSQWTSLMIKQQPQVIADAASINMVSKSELSGPKK